MISKSPAFWVLSKELKEILRDKRVRTGAVFTPIFVVIMMVSVFGVISSSIGKDAKHKVSVVGNDGPIAKALDKAPKLKVSSVASEALGRDLIKGGKSNLVVQVKNLSPGHVQVEFLFDPKEEQASVAKAAVQEALLPYIASVTLPLLAAHQISTEELTPVTFKDVPIKVGDGDGAGSIIVSILPYMMVLFTFTGGFSIAADMVAGEKEKNTLETLLITPADRTQIVLGKFMAIATVCLISALSSVAGLVLASSLHLPGSDIMFGSGLGLSVTSFAVILVTLLPLVAFFAGLLVSVSSFARNVREAQTMLSTVNLVILIPAVFSQVIGFTDFAHANWINFVPVLGTAMNIRQAFQGKASWLFAGESILTGTVLAIAMLYIAVRLFVREEVLVRV